MKIWPLINFFVLIKNEKNYLLKWPEKHSLQDEWIESVPIFDFLNSLFQIVKKVALSYLLSLSPQRFKIAKCVCFTGVLFFFAFSQSYLLNITGIYKYIKFYTLSYIFHSRANGIYTDCSSQIWSDFLNRIKIWHFKYSSILRRDFKQFFFDSLADSNCVYHYSVVLAQSLILFDKYYELFS